MASPNVPFIGAYQWAGLATNSSPHLLPPGAATEQVNLQCLYPGALTVRGGITAENFDNAGNYPSWPDLAGGSLSSPAVGMFRLLNDGNEWTIWQTADGKIYGKLGAV